MPQSPFRIGYSTSGFSSHRLEDALEVIASLGYEAVSLTLDVQHLDPFAPDLSSRSAMLRNVLERLDLCVVVETGARFLLDPFHKHQPTLMSRDGSTRRESFLKTALDVARDLGASGLSLWAGRKPLDMSEDEARSRLLSGLDRVLSHGARVGVRIGLEPEPGMFVDTVAGYHALARELGGTSRLGLALDVGHLLVTGEGEPGEIIRAEAPHLVCVAIEDMKRTVHEHLPFGEGDLDLGAVIRALGEGNFQGIVSVELGRHGHDAVNIATRSREYLRRCGVRFREADLLT